MRSRKRGIALSIALLAVLVVETVMPAASTVARAHSVQDNQPQDSKIVAIDQSEPTPQLKKRKRERIEVFAQQVASALVLQKDGKVNLNSGATLGFDQEQDDILSRLVEDVNSGKLGIAVQYPDGSTRLYGSKKALAEAIPNPGDVHIENNFWVNWQGVHIYVDSWWTNQLANLQGWAIGAVIGLIVTALCSSGVGCAAAGLITSFVWDIIIWQIVRRYYPDSFTINAPWWGYVDVQPWRAGAWYNGVRFRSWLWT